MMEAGDTLNIIRDYYSRADVIKCMVGHCYLREFSMIGAKNTGGLVHRFLSCEKDSQFKTALKCSGFMDGAFLYNLYRSIATYHPGFHFSYIGSRSKTEEMARWRVDGSNSIVNYDFFIDIDAPGLGYMDVAKEDAIKVLRWLEKHSFQATCNFSGMGFHIIVPGQTMSYAGLSFVASSPINAYQYLSGIAKVIQQEITTFIDSAIYDDKRLAKIPGSLALYKDMEPIVTRAFHHMKDLEGFDVRGQIYSRWIASSLRKDAMYYGRGNIITRPDCSTLGGVRPEAVLSEVKA